MIKYKQLTLIGTSHIAEQSIQEVRSAVEAEKPGIIAIELDKKRLAGLLDKSHKRLKLKEIFRLGVKAYLFILIASYIQKKLVESGEREIIENSPEDDFWGWGPNKDGQNEMGKLWMKLREELKNNGRI